MLTKIQPITFGMILLSSVGPTWSSQEPARKQEYFEDSDKRLINCEQYSADIDRMSMQFADLIARSDFFILVARLGHGETNAELNRRRLHNVQERLKDRGIEAKKIVVAQGERVKGLGRVEFYVGGRMVESLRVKRNEDICVECCGDDERFYPYKEVLERKSKPSRRKRG